MNEQNLNFEEISNSNKKISLVDSLENLRKKITSNSIVSRLNKKELLEELDGIIDTIPVELRTARWIVREQESFINHAKEEADEIIKSAKIESEKLIADSYVLQEAVIEANALIKQAETESQHYRASVEDSIDIKIDEVLHKVNQLATFLELEKQKLREPRNIDQP